MLQGDTSRTWLLSALAVLHYLAVLPVSAVRTWWIANETGVNFDTVSMESLEEGLNVVQVADSLKQTVVPIGRCGNCSCEQGDFRAGDEVYVFGRNFARVPIIHSINQSIRQSGKQSNNQSGNQSNPQAEL